MTESMESHIFTHTGACIAKGGGLTGLALAGVLIGRESI